MKQNRGFTLVELIIFILVITIGVAILLPAFLTLRTSHNLDDNLVALKIAEARLELIMSTKNSAGFANINDPCLITLTNPACNVSDGYTVTSNIENSWQNDFNYKIISVTVSGKGSAHLTTLVANV